MMRLCSGLVVLAFAGSVRADQPPEICQAAVENDALLLTVCKQVPVTKTVTVEVIENGVKVQKVQTITVNESITVVQKIPLSAVKATTATGKPIPADKLGDQLNDKKLAVVSRGSDVPDEYRKLFKDDVVILKIEMAKP